MKWSVIIVFGVLISVTYGTKYCELRQGENDKCGNNGKCTKPECAPAPAKTTAAPSATKATAAPSTAKTTAAPPTAKAATATAGTRRKRRGADPVVAKCTPTCTDGKVCKYKCTGESGSIKHGLSPLVLLVGVLTKLFLIG